MTSLLLRSKHAAVAALSILFFAGCGGGSSAGSPTPDAFKPTSTPPQASLVLSDADVVLCHHNETDWTLTKTASEDEVTNEGTVTWTVTATRGATSDDFLSVNGFVSITNGGSGDATIGNIVVNLQRSLTDPNGSTAPNWSGSKWISAAANVADATSGDAATGANIVASSSQENASWNSLIAANYVVSGAQGTFTEGLGSGTLEFTDVDNNTAFAMVPQPVIPGGATVNLLFIATFNNTDLGIPVGETIRAEVLVTFGNSGARGGSGASATNIDIDGSGSVESDEANVRTVPTRITRDVPALEECNDTVTLTDPGISGVTGSVEFSGFDSGGIGDGVEISETTSFTVTVFADGGLDGGDICNDAFLAGESEYVSVITSTTTTTDPLTGVVTTTHTYATFPCCVGADLSDSSCVTVPGEEVLPPEGLPELTTYSQGGWGQVPNNNNTNVGAILAANFAAVFPSGIEVGIPGGSGFSMKFTSAAAVAAYLPGGGTSGVLSGDLLNPTSSSGGAFAAQLLALKINVAMSGALVTEGGLGSLVLFDTGTSLDGSTIAAILAAAETALGGGGFPAGYTASTFNDLLANLNLAFHEGDESDFAVEHLTL